MKEKVKCPECGLRYGRSARRCPDCGTENPRERTSQGWRACSYECDGKRCPLPAVWWDNPYGKDGAGLCWVHMRSGARGHDALAADELDRIIANPSAYVRRVDWHDTLVDGVIERHPEWQRGADEPRSVYVGRMRALRGELEGLVGTGRRPPPPDRAALIEDALEEYEERAGKLEAEGVPRELAQSQALEDVLRTRLGAGPA